MHRLATIAAALLALVLVVGASALGAPAERASQRGPLADPSGAPLTQETDETEPDENGTPSARLLDRIVAKLEGAGITTDADTLASLAADYGVGGAVRLVAWAHASGLTPAEIGAMFDGGMGWGEIARQLNDANEELDLGPGIGWVMGKGAQNGGPGNGIGLGRAGAPGQQKLQ